jgi:tetratricopeptide (TPR) repeat protein
MHVARRLESIAWAVLIGIGAMPATAAAAHATTQARVSCAEPARLFATPPRRQPFTLQVASGVRWLEIDERGQQLDVSGTPGLRSLRLSQPLRWGQHWLQLPAGASITVRRTESASAPNRFAVVAHCTPSVAEIDWLAELGDIDQRINSPRDRATALQARDDLERLQATAADAASRALVVHYRALALNAGNEPRAAAAEFARAERAWQDVDKPGRADAARAGRIEAEYASEQLDAVLRDTEATARLRARSYFQARTLNTRCLALADLGRFAPAATCYRDALADFRRLDEMPEYASTLKNAASLQLRRGDLREARRLARVGLKFAAGPYAPMTRGRLLLLLAVLDRQQGDLAASLRNLDAARSQLQQAGSEALFWRASSLLEEASLMQQLGSYPEAYAALAAATRLIAPADSLAPRARILAGLDAATHRFAAARWWYRVAEYLYARQKMGPAREVTRLARLQVEVEAGDIDEAQRVLAGPRSRVGLYEPQWQLLAAQVALRRGDLATVAQDLRAVRGKPLALVDQRRLAVIEAELDDRSGDAPAAARVLHAMAGSIESVARMTRNPVLRHVVEREVLPLRRAAFERMLGGSVQAAPDPAAIVAWFAVADAPGSDTAAGLADDRAFDEAVAAELLAPGSAGRAAAQGSAQRQLLAILARNAGTAATAVPAPDPPSVAALQHALDGDSAFIAYLGGRTRGGLLWVTADSARVVAAASPDTVRAAGAALRELLQSAASPRADIEAATQRLSAALLGHLSGPVPRRLYVLPDETTAAVAWSALRWPGHEQPLLDSTATSVVRLTRDQAPLPPPPAALDLIVSAQARSRRALLPELTGAAVEAGQIAPLLGAHDMRLRDHAAATQVEVLAALAAPGAWVHVAAHGAAQPQRVGYGGIWLEPAAADLAPPVLRWLDVLDTGARPDLVVLDACRLGDSGNVAGANSSFAGALVDAGARRVVAAAWPLSDAAAAVWVPAFYAALFADPQHDAAQALRAAQLRLRRSRAFAHPFFWASLQALARLSVAPVAASAAK